jgi:predicted PurR-regulated permease PerM
VKTVGARIPGVVTTSVWAAMQLLITFLVLFYFLRDRDQSLALLRSLSPLTERETARVFKRVSETIRGTVFGTLVVAVVQGILGGAMFWLLGLPAPVLWGAVMAILSTVPVLGAFVIWLPTAGFLALGGDWGKALILAIWGSVVVSLIDNLLYPVLVGSKLRLHTLPVFFAIVGGLIVFGGSGLILGPVVLALTVALIEAWRQRTRGGHTVEEGAEG